MSRFTTQAVNKDLLNKILTKKNESTATRDRITGIILGRMFGFAGLAAFGAVWAGQKAYEKLSEPKEFKGMASQSTIDAMADGVTLTINAELKDSPWTISHLPSDPLTLGYLAGLCFAIIAMMMNVKNSRIPEEDIPVYVRRILGKLFPANPDVYVMIEDNMLSGNLEFARGQDIGGDNFRAVLVNNFRSTGKMLEIVKSVLGKDLQPSTPLDNETEVSGIKTSVDLPRQIADKIKAIFSDDANWMFGSKSSALEDMPNSAYQLGYLMGMIDALTKIAKVAESESTLVIGVVFSILYPSDPQVLRTALRISGDEEFLRGQGFSKNY